MKQLIIAIILIIIGMTIVYIDDDENYKIDLKITGTSITLERIKDSGGIMHISGENFDGFYKGLGYLMAKDRLTQLYLQKLVAQGRLSELDASAKNAEIDTYFREVDFTTIGNIIKNNLNDIQIKAINDFCDGIEYYNNNEMFPRSGILVMAGYELEKFTIDDVLRTAVLTMWFGLADNQGFSEKLFIELIQKHDNQDKIKELFYPFLNELDQELIKHIKDVKITKRKLEQNIKSKIPVMKASNNWIIHKKLAKNGSTIAVNDPHLEISRIPSVWYETKFTKTSTNDVWIGVSAVGFPAYVYCKTPWLSYGLTYGFVDQVQNFMTIVKDGKYKFENEWLPFTKRVEIIGKGEHLYEAEFLEIHGEHSYCVLERDNNTKGSQIEDGTYLCRAWSVSIPDPEGMFHALFPVMEAKNVRDAQKLLASSVMAANFLIGDENDIAYQQSGSNPKRKAGYYGLIPSRGWLKSENWQGLNKQSDLNSVVSPKEGYLVTANNNWQKENGPRAVNLHMGENRANRVAQLIEELLQRDADGNPTRKLDVEDLKKIQFDVYSQSAKESADIFRPFVEKHQAVNPKAAKLILDFDYNYSLDSEGATVFELAYRFVRKELYQDFFGQESFDLIEASSFLEEYAYWYDSVLLQNKKSWFVETSRDDFLDDAIERFLKQVPEEEVGKRYGLTVQVAMNNIALDGKLPKFLGFDRTFELPGTRDSISQGSKFVNDGRFSCFAPSLRFIADFANDYVETVLPQGVSGRRFSRYYMSDHENYLNKKYKKIWV